MRKHYFGRQFKRDANERKALFKGLMTSLVLYERIETTEAKAKAIRGSVEKLITKAKTRGAGAEQFLQPSLSAVAVEKVLTDLAPRFADRPGGYTRIIKKGRRFSDDAAMAIIEWVDRPVVAEVVTPAADTEVTKLETKKTAKPEAKRAEKKEEVKVETKETAVETKSKKRTVKKNTEANEKKA